jgi:hypothetical protein
VHDFVRLGRKPSQPGKADMPVLCAWVFLGFFLSRSDQCAAGDQDNPVILTISPGWLEVMVVLVDDLLHVAPAALDFEELLVSGGDVLGGQVQVEAAQQVLAVQVLLGLDLLEVRRLTPDRKSPESGDSCSP